MSTDEQRTIGLFGATGIGIGAIVGGGILALAGAALAATGPGAMLAFACNGAIAIATALSFAELSSRFPASGGTYTFARKVLSVEAAFMVGWIVWFASIVAGVLYALGFGAFGAVALDAIWRAAGGTPPEWLTSRWGQTGLACLGIVGYTLSLLRTRGGGGAWINVGKLVVFAVLIAAGLVAFVGAPKGTLTETMSPFLTNGAAGLFQAMGFTFIALQGFDLIAAVAGEVKSPARTIPRAMLLSLATALAIYLPLLFVISTVGAPAGSTIAEAAAAAPETIVADAVRHYWGDFGYWLVVVAAVLSMLSALQANLFAASRVALSMSEDRTLPAALEFHGRRGTPVTAIVVTSAITLAITMLVPDVAGAGAAASLIFLVTFALAHLMNVLARRRVVASRTVFRTPLFPLVPIVGGLACAGLAVYQAIVVPEAGWITVGWLATGGVLFLAIFGQRARIRDAAAEADDPILLKLRGRSPAVLVPVANPAHAGAMVQLAHTLTAPGVGRVTVLNVVGAGGDLQDDDAERALRGAQSVLRESLIVSLQSGLAPEALTTVAPDVWREIRRVARAHDCESILLGLHSLEVEREGSPLEDFLGSIERDCVVLRAPVGWSISNVRRILVAAGGRSHQAKLRARLVSSLARQGERELTYATVVPPGAPAELMTRRRRALERTARDEAHGRAKIALLEGVDVTETVTREASAHDLVILGLPRGGGGSALFGDIAPRIARESGCAIIMISQHD